MSKCSNCDKREKPAPDDSSVVGICLIEQIQAGKGCEDWETCNKKEEKKIYK